MLSMVKVRNMTKERVISIGTDFQASKCTNVEKCVSRHLFSRPTVLSGENGTSLVTQSFPNGGGGPQSQHPAK